jgi:2-keto-3-deoxy-L-rhamnonate aldolase RhmA
MKNLKDKIRSGETVHGCWINLGSTVSAEIVGQAGFDWVLIDLEHGAGDVAILYQQLQALSGSTSTPIVRIDNLSRPKVQRILDAGASGIMFPQIQTSRETDEAIRMMYYPPRGVRGLAKMIRATGFGRTANEYMANVEKNLVGVIQIETTNALQNIDAIAATEGVDVLFVGPNDLSLSLGILGQINHPLYQQSIRDVARAAKKHGKATGVLLQDINEYEMYHKLGYRFLACGGDSGFVRKGAEDVVKTMNDKAKIADGMQRMGQL